MKQLVAGLFILSSSLGFSQNSDCSSTCTIEVYENGSAFFGVRVTRACQQHGAIVYEIIDNSPAEIAGLELGDRIISFNGIEVENYLHLVDIVQSSSTDQVLEFEVMRNGKLLTFRTQLIAGEAKLVKKEICCDDMVHESMGQIHIYPNPSQGDITLSYELMKTGQYRIDILDVSGKLVYHETNTLNENGQIQFDLNLLKRGVYQLMLSNEQQRYVKSLVIN